VSAARITVATDHPYDVAVGRGLLARFAEFVPPGARRLMIVFDPAAAGPIPALVDELRRDGFEVHLLAVPSGEEAKTAAVAAAAWQRLGEADFTRTDAVVGIGGGATCDLAGSSRRPGCGACRWSRPRPLCWPWSTPRSAARPASTPARARTWSGFSTSRRP
jgi:hypothetical protein